MTFNLDKCGSSIFCEGAYYTPIQLRRELSRQTAGLLSLIMDSSLWRTLELATVLWGTYSLTSGLNLLLLRVRSAFKRSIQNLSCCSLFLAFFSSLDMALNPLGLSRLEIKLQVREVQDQLELISQQQTILSQNYKFIAQSL